MKFHRVSWLALAWSGFARAATADDWRGRAIYQVLTDRFSLENGSTTAPCDTALGKYCGGSWQGVINNLDYIQNMGFSAIWISPVTANIQQYTTDLGSYHGYWQQNIYELNTHFGTDEDLQALSKALHDRGMYIMVDVVTNDLAWAGNHSSVDYSQLIPFNNVSYYHSYCPVNDSDSQTDCWLGDDVVTLPDLRTEDSDVQDIFNTWISTLVTKYNIDGLRLDSAGNVNPSFFPSFCGSAGIFCTGEVYSGIPELVCPYQEVLDSTLNYPIYFPLIRAFNSTDGTMWDLVNEINGMHAQCKDPTLLAAFSENHDQPRFASFTQDFALAKNVLTYTFADGIPIIYEGQEQHYSGGNNPFNREAIWLSAYKTTSPLYTFITTLNAFRSHVVSVSSSYLTYQNWVIYNDDHTIAMRKGYNGSQVVTVLNNDGENGGSRNVSLGSAQTGFNASMVVTDVVSCVNTTIRNDGTLQVVVEKGLPIMFYPASLLVDSEICKATNTAAVPTTTGTSTSPHGTKKSRAARLDGWGAVLGLEICCLAIIAMML